MPRKRSLVKRRQRTLLESADRETKAFVIKKLRLAAKENAIRDARLKAQSDAQIRVVRLERQKPGWGKSLGIRSRYSQMKIFNAMQEAGQLTSRPRAFKKPKQKKK